MRFLFALSILQCSVFIFTSAYSSTDQVQEIVIDQAQKQETPQIRRRLKNNQEEQKTEKNDDQVDNSAALRYNLPASAAEWCSPPILPKLNYEKCKNKQMINSVPLFGGLTNSLKMVLLGTILSFEEDKCFFVDESESELLHRGDKSESLDSFIERYFEPIGLSAKDPRVKRAKNNKKIDVKDWTKVWEDTSKRRMYGQTSTIDSLSYPNIEGHHLKRVMLRRMWRPLPKWRDKTCQGLANHVQGDEFMTFSVRRGDKSTEENFSFATMQQYVDMADQVVPTHFNGRVPTIFVATDDCTVMEELRNLRPNWKFVSECDKTQNTDPGHAGFALADMKAWSQDATDAHYAKFFIELYAMASARVFIGVWYTNVSWWAQFMRVPDRSTYIMLDTPGTSEFALDWN